LSNELYLSLLSTPGINGLGISVKSAALPILNYHVTRWFWSS